VVLTVRHAEVARTARAGQFVMIKAGTSAEPPLRRPFSILTVDPGRETFRLFLKAIGPGTRALAALAPGDLAQCLGPLGRPFTAPPPGHEALLVGRRLRHRAVPPLLRGAASQGRARARLLRRPHRRRPPGARALRGA
jgi:dihydroorotate dehydrogenase electron transfer subunit